MWAADIKEEISVEGATTRAGPLVVTFRTAAFGRSTSYTSLAYDYSEGAPRTILEADQRATSHSKRDRELRLRRRRRHGGTNVTYHLEAEAAGAHPGNTLRCALQEPDHVGNPAMS